MFYCNLAVQKAKSPGEAKEQGEHEAVWHSYHSAAATQKITVPGKQGSVTEPCFAKIKSSFLSNLASRDSAKDPIAFNFSFFS